MSVLTLKVTPFAESQCSINTSYLVCYLRLISAKFLFMKLHDITAVDKTSHISLCIATRSDQILKMTKVWE